MLLGANPVSESFTVNVWVLGFHLRFAAPVGTCFRVALAVAELLVDVDVGVDEEAAVVLVPQPTRSNTTIMLIRASVFIFRFVKDLVTIVTPFQELRPCASFLEASNKRSA